MSQPRYFQTSRSPLSPAAGWPDEEAPVATVPPGILNEAAEAVRYQGLKQKLIKLLNTVEITGDEKRRGMSSLTGQTWPIARLETWRDNLRHLIQQRRNKQGLRGTLTPACLAMRPTSVQHRPRQAPSRWALWVAGLQTAHLLRAYGHADQQAYTARHQAACQCLDAYECDYRAYKAFRRTLYQYRPMPYTLYVRIAGGILAAVLLKLIHAF